MPKVDMFDASVPDERAEWRRRWETWPDRQVFAHPDYVKLFARRCDRVLCASGTSESGGALFPFLLRPLAEEPWAVPGERAWDLVGPYGYGGIFAWNFPAEHAEAFCREFQEWLAAQAVVTSFVRLSLFPEETLPFFGSTEVRAPNVVRSLDLTPDELWHDYEHKVRKNVNRAKQLQLEAEIDGTGRRLEDFLSIYYSTMDRRDASGSYYFPREFFETILCDLPGQFVFVHVLQAQKVVSTELALVSVHHVYSFLGGTLAEAYASRPNDLLKHELILWARQEGKRAFVLGGGYGGEDGIYKYKKSFAPKGTVDFRVGTAIHDLPGCERLRQRRQAWEAQQGSGWQPLPVYFPEYRA